MYRWLLTAVWYLLLLLWRLEATTTFGLLVLDSDDCPADRGVVVVEQRSRVATVARNDHFFANAGTLLVYGNQRVSVRRDSVGQQGHHHQ